MSQPRESLFRYAWAPALLWKRRITLARVGLIGSALSIVLALVLPVKYESTARIMPPDAQSKIGTALLASAMGGASPNIASGGLASLVSSRSPNAVFLSILGSRTAQDDLIDRLDLRRVYHCKLYLDARKELVSRTRVEDDRKTGVLTLTVTADTPRRAQDMAAAYIDELNRLVVKMDTSSAHQERVFLESRLKDVKQDLDSATAGLSQFSSRNATMDVQGQAQVTLNATARLQGELIATESQLDGLKAIYTEKNPRVEGLQARVSSLRRELGKMGGHANKDPGDPPSAEPYPSLRELPLLGATYSQLYERAKIEQTIYEVLSRQYELARVQEAQEIPAVKLLDPPNYPEKKSFPPRTLIVLLGTLLVLIAEAAWLIGTEAWKSADDSHPKKAALHQAVSLFRRTLHGEGTSS